jgi:hypothetical protein
MVGDVTVTPPLPGNNQLAEALDQLAEYLAQRGNNEQRVIMMSAILVASVSVSVLDRPTPRPSTLVPRLTVDHLREALEIFDPNIIDFARECLAQVQ